MNKVVEIIKSIEEDKKNLEFIPTGFSLLDKQLDGGFMKKELIIVGAFTGVGKSIFGGQIFYQVVQKGFKSAYFSLEISNTMIVARLIGQLSNIKPTRIIAGMLDLEEFDRKIEAKAKITAFNEDMDFYDDLYFMGDLDKQIRQNKYEFVVIDFIQNIQIAKNMDEYARLSFLSIQLQWLAKQTNCCIMILSQLSNKVGRDGSKIIEYKGSGGIAMVADLGFVLRREEKETFLGNKQIVNLELMKNRRGLSGQKFAFNFIHPGGLLEEQE